MNATPPLEPGLTLVEQPDVGALHRLILDSDTDGETLWVDAGGAASTYGLTAQVPNRRALRGIRVARAFTAHQHHELVRTCVAEASGRTGLVVAPNVAALYEAADASDAEIEPLFQAAVALLSDLADALAIPVLVSAPRATAEHRAAIDDAADREIACESTGLGYAYETEGFETQGYFHEGWWQTTIPYWAQLCGVRAWDEAWATARTSATAAAIDRGVIDPNAATPQTSQSPIAADGGW